MLDLEPSSGGTVEILRFGSRPMDGSRPRMTRCVPARRAWDVGAVLFPKSICLKRGSTWTHNSGHSGLERRRAGDDQSAGGSRARPLARLRIVSKFVPLDFGRRGLAERILVPNGCLRI